MIYIKNQIFYIKNKNMMKVIKLLKILFNKYKELLNIFNLILVNNLS